MIVSIGSDPGQSIYAIFIDDSTQKYWNGSSFEDAVAGHYSSYAVTTSDPLGIGRYTVTVPASITAGTTCQVFFYVGASPAIGDRFVGSTSITIAAAAVTATLTGNNTAAYTAQLNAIDTQINAMISAPRPNYKVGNTDMAYGDLLETLYKIREKILLKLQSLQSESFETLNTDVNQFGQDIADYINEASE